MEDEQKLIDRIKKFKQIYGNDKNFHRIFLPDRPLHKDERKQITNEE